MNADTQNGSSSSDEPDVEAFIAAHPDGASMEEVAAALGVSRVAVWKVECKALTKLRLALSNRGLARSDL